MSYSAASGGCRAAPQWIAVIQKDPELQMSAAQNIAFRLPEGHPQNVWLTRPVGLKHCTGRQLMVINSHCIG